MVNLMTLTVKMACCNELIDIRSNKKIIGMNGCFST